jgi:hypothetical protein
VPGISAFMRRVEISGGPFLDRVCFGTYDFLYLRIDLGLARFTSQFICSTPGSGQDPNQQTTKKHAGLLFDIMVEGSSVSSTRPKTDQQEGHDLQASLDPLEAGLYARRGCAHSPGVTAACTYSH